MPTEEELFTAVDQLLEGEPQLPPPAERARLREVAGVTQARLAQVLRTTVQSVKNWESPDRATEPRQPRRRAYQRLLDGWAVKYPAVSGTDPDASDVTPATVPQTFTPAPTEAEAGAAPLRTAKASGERPAHTSGDAAAPRAQESSRTRSRSPVLQRAVGSAGRGRHRVLPGRCAARLPGGHDFAAGGLGIGGVRDRAGTTQPARQGRRSADHADRLGRRAVRAAGTASGPAGPAPCGGSPGRDATREGTVEADTARVRPVAADLPARAGRPAAVRAAGDPAVGRSGHPRVGRCREPAPG